jgi:hypothetical protein
MLKNQDVCDVIVQMDRDHDQDDEDNDKDDEFFCMVYSAAIKYLSEDIIKQGRSIEFPGLLLSLNFDLSETSNTACCLAE